MLEVATEPEKKEPIAPSSICVAAQGGGLGGKGDTTRAALLRQQLKPALRAAGPHADGDVAAAQPL